MQCPYCGHTVFISMREKDKMHSAFECLKRNCWNRTFTAQQLGVSLRTIRNWIKLMKKWGWKVEESTKKRPRNNAWTLGEINVLKNGHLRGASVSELGHVLGRTEHAIISKIRALMKTGDWYESTADCKLE